jgi:hypothetical protein
LAGAPFDVRGLVQLSSDQLETRALHYPRWIPAIPIWQACRRLHFFQAADGVAGTDVTVAFYVVHWADGRVERIPIRYGIEALPWDWEPDPANPAAAVAWSGLSPAGLPVWLFRTTWTNAHPEVAVAAIDLELVMENAAPFVVAITAE